MIADVVAFLVLGGLGLYNVGSGLTVLSMPKTWMSSNFNQEAKVQTLWGLFLLILSLGVLIT